MNGKDLEAVIAHAQEDIVVFGLYSPFPIIGKTAFRALIQDYFDGNETASLKPAHQEYQVIGQTGVVWGLYQLETRPKGGAFQSVNGQYMFTYARPEGTVAHHQYALCTPPKGKLTRNVINSP